jgi:hypothetical protein
LALCVAHAEKILKAKRATATLSVILRMAAPFKTLKAIKPMITLSAI